MSGITTSGSYLQKEGLRITPTYPQSELTFILDDYGKKGSITFRFSGGDTPSAGTGTLADDRLFAALSEAIEEVYATIRRGRNGQGS